jgi:sugar phosphate isomerase/epimerase
VQRGAVGVDVPLTRRRFLGVAGSSLGALWFGLPAVLGGARVGAGLQPVGLQLYTLRQAMRESVERTLERVVAIGYREVEFAGYFGRTPRQVRELLDAVGLAAPSAHSADLNTIRNDWSRALQAALEIGHEYLVCPSLPASERTEDGYRRVAELFNRAGEQASALGLRLGFHNHDAEYQPLGASAVRGYDILLTETDPRYVVMQLDVYWIARAGEDPVRYFSAHSGRYVSVHVKDMDATGRMTEVGSGVLSFQRYLAAARLAGVRHFFVEHDNPADPFASVETSYRYLSSLEL